MLKNNLEQIQARESKQKELFALWRKHEVTQLMFKRLKEERERMVDMVIYDGAEFPDNVKGRIAAIDRLLEIEWGDIYSE